MRPQILHTFTLLIISTLILNNVVSQTIDSIQVLPSTTPGVNDTITILVHNTFNSGDCAGTATYNTAGFNINASALHCIGPLAYICHDIDTVILHPPFPAGIYHFNFTLSTGSGGFPCTPGITPDDTSSISINVGNVPTGLSEGSEKQVIIYPNPASDQLFVETDSDASTYRISVLSLDGRTLDLPMIQHGNKITINTENVPAGIYLVNLADKNKPVMRKRVVIR